MFCIILKAKTMLKKGKKMIMENSLVQLSYFEELLDQHRSGFSATQIKVFSQTLLQKSNI